MAVKSKPKLNNPRANYSDWAQHCYSPAWREVSSHAKDLTKGKCCLCNSFASVTHHAFYTQDGQGDCPGYNLFPLCKNHHREAHQLKRFNNRTGKWSGNWIVDSKHPVKGRYNDAEFLVRLRHGWAKSITKKSSNSFWWWVAIAVVIVALMMR